MTVFVNESNSTTLIGDDLFSAFTGLFNSDGITISSFDGNVYNNNIERILSRNTDLSSSEISEIMQEMSDNVTVKKSSLGKLANMCIDGFEPAKW